MRRPGLETEWRSPPAAYKLESAHEHVLEAGEKNAHGQVYGIGRARVKLHVGGGGPEWERLRSQVVETSAWALIEEVRAVVGRRHLCLEKGTLAGWLYEVLEPHVHELVVVG